MPLTYGDVTNLASIYFGVLPYATREILYITAWEALFVRRNRTQDPCFLLVSGHELQRR